MAKAQEEEQQSVEEYLLAETNQKAQGRKEDRQDYLTRVAKAVVRLPDDWYNEQDDEVKAWADTSATAIKDKTEMPDFEEEAVEEEEEPEPEPAPRGRGRPAAAASTPTSGRGRATVVEEPEEEPAPRGRGRGRGAQEETPTRGRRRGEPVEEEEEERSTNAPDRIKELLSEDISLSDEDLLKTLEDEGLELSPIAVSALRNDFLRTVQFLQAANQLKENLVE